MLALVVATYGYPAGGIRRMLWEDFCLLWRELDRVRTQQTLIAAHGATLGGHIAWNGKESAAVKKLAEMEREVLRG